jgi:hypothetical protein
MPKAPPGRRCLEKQPRVGHQPKWHVDVGRDPAPKVVCQIYSATEGLRERIAITGKSSVGKRRECHQTSSRTRACRRPDKR